MTPASQIGRRPVNTGVPFYAPMSVPFTGAAGEQVSGQTSKNQNTDLTIIGGITDIQGVQGQFTMTGKEPPALWSSESIPMRPLLGKVDMPRPHWPRSTFMLHGRRLEGQFVNTNGVGAGTIVFVCKQPALQNADLIRDPQNLGEMKIVPLDSQFTGVANEEFSATTEEMHFNYALYGFYTDLTEASVKIIDCESRRWMTDWTKIWGLAARPSSDMQFMHLPDAYIIPAGKSIEVAFKNDSTAPDASGQLYLYGQRLQ